MMHTLGRQIRFSIDPFSDQLLNGANPYSSRPLTEGVGVNLALWVELTCQLDSETGFVVNVSEIDNMVRRDVIPLFVSIFKDDFSCRKMPSLVTCARILRQSWEKIESAFRPIAAGQLRLDLSPFRQIAIQAKEANMFIYTEKFEFSAMHQLWNDNFSSEKNFELFGKCANLSGHGHNYVLEVSVERPEDSQEPNWTQEFQEDVKKHFIECVDHKNLNVDVPGLENVNPTVENLSFFAWERLDGQLRNSKLQKILIWENDRTYCSYQRP